MLKDFEETDVNNDVERELITGSMSEWLCYLFFNQCTTEVIFYFVVDKVITYRLKSAKNDQEKKRILFEGGVMLFLVSIFVWFHHFPYIFLTMALCTLLSSVDLGYYLNDMVTGDLWGKYGGWLSSSVDKVRSFGESKDSGFGSDAMKILKSSLIQLSCRARTVSSSHHPNSTRGLVNEENLCFFNCVIQVLSRNDHFVDELEKLRPYLGQNDSVLRELLKLFTRLRAGNYSTEPLETSALRKVIFLNSKRIMGKCLIQHPDLYKQERQDVAEFFNWILSLLTSSLKTVKKAEETRQNSPSCKHLANLYELYNKPNRKEIQQLRLIHAKKLNSSSEIIVGTQGNADASHIANLDWLNTWTNERQATVVEDLFTGQSMAFSVCYKHKELSLKTDLFKIINLAIPRDGVTIQECLVHHTSERHLVDATLHPQCTICSHSVQGLTASSPVTYKVVPSVQNFIPTEAFSPIPKQMNQQQLPSLTPSVPRFSSPYSKRIGFTRLPGNLTIQLMRYKVENDKIASGRTVKLRHMVSCDLELDMEPFLAKDEDSVLSGSKYFLYAVILNCSPEDHNNGCKALVRTSEDVWHRFEDELVTPIPEVENYLKQTEVKENVYLLFYCNR